MLTDQYWFYVFCQRDSSEAGPVRARGGGGRSGPHILWPKASLQITSPRSWSVWKVIITIIKKKALRGVCRGIVVCVRFVLPQWPRARSQAVTGAAERLLQKADTVHSALMAFFQDKAPKGSSGASGGPGEPWVRRGRGCWKEWLPAGISAAWPSTEHRHKKASSLHGAWALTSLLMLGGGYPQCPAPLTGSPENRFGLWNFSSISLKESRIPRSDFFGPLSIFPFYMNLPLWEWLFSQVLNRPRIECLWILFLKQSRIRHPWIWWRMAKDAFVGWLLPIHAQDSKAGNEGSFWLGLQCDVC